MTRSAVNVSFYGRRGGTGLAGVTLGALLALGVGAGCSKSTVQDGGVDISGASLTNGQVAQVLKSVNDAEIAQAQIALMKYALMDVKNYAQRMQDDHTAANQRQATLFQQNNITLADSAVNTTLVQHAAANTAQLNTVGNYDLATSVEDGGVVVPDGGGNAASLFDKTYIDIQYREHDEVLTVIDTALLKAVQNEPLRNELNTTRTAVQDHRDMAKTLRDRIGTP